MVKYGADTSVENGASLDGSVFRGFAYKHLSYNGKTANSCLTVSTVAPTSLTVCGNLGSRISIKSYGSLNRKRAGADYYVDRNL
jgi:hypothetical protein